MITINSKVKVINSGSPFWGQFGVVVTEDPHGPFYVYGVSFEEDPEDRQRIFHLSENEVEEIPVVDLTGYLTPHPDAADDDASDLGLTPAAQKDFDAIAGDHDDLLDKAEQYKKERDEAREQLETLRRLCAAAYQMAGCYYAPVEFLDNLSAAAQGEPLLHDPMDGLPVVNNQWLEEIEKAKDREQKILRICNRVGAAERSLHPWDAIQQIGDLLAYPPEQQIPVKYKEQGE